MTNEEILRIALQQSAVDSNCRAEDFLSEQNVVVVSSFRKGARKYLTSAFDCDLTSYGSNIVASVREDLQDTVRAYIDKYSIGHCFETPNLHALNDALREKGLLICFMAEYFLPDVQSLRVLPCAYETRVLPPKEFAHCYTPEWGNALSAKRKEDDRLAVGAYDGGRLIGLAGCSADCEAMWQIGIDVLPEYRRKGVASALTSRLATEILERGKVPFYCAAWSNLRSVRNALASGFKPAWVQMTAKNAAFVEEMNR